MSPHYQSSIWIEYKQRPESQHPFLTEHNRFMEFQNSCWRSNNNERCCKMLMAWRIWRRLRWRHRSSTGQSSRRRPQDDRSAASMRPETKLRRRQLNASITEEALWPLNVQHHKCTSLNNCGWSGNSSDPDFPRCRKKKQRCWMTEPCCEACCTHWDTSNSFGKTVRIDSNNENTSLMICGLRFRVTIYKFTNRTIPTPSKM